MQRVWRARLPRRGCRLRERAIETADRDLDAAWLAVDRGTIHYVRAEGGGVHRADSPALVFGPAFRGE